MKILFLGDSSNYHNCVAGALSAMGHDVTVASAGSRWMDTRRDIDLSRKPGLIGGLSLYIRMLYLCSTEFKGYDIVQLHDPVFAELRPERLRPLFDRIKKNNGKVFLTSLANDTPYVQMCTGPDCPLSYNEFRVGGRPTAYAMEHPEIELNWLNPPLSDFSKHIRENVDGCVTALYEYHLAMEPLFPADNIAYAGIPVDMPQTAELPKIGDGPIRILAACHKGREKEKGFDLLLSAVERVAEANPGKVEINMAQNVPFSEFEKMLGQAHIVVDQLYSYTPATTALMAMARGKAVVSGGEEKFYKFIGEDKLRPIINASPLDIPGFERKLQSLIDDRSKLEELMRQGPQFVAKHNSAEVVAHRMLDFWQSKA